LPTTYIFAPLAEQFDADTSDAQPVFILINAPANGDQHTLSEQEIARCQDRMLAHLETCGITLRPVAETLTATTPDIFAARFPQTGGALFGRAGHSPLAPFRRPGARSKLPGLYLTGGSVHPGPGVPMAALSGRTAAETIMSDFDLIHA
ncbi:MAG: FAD-dependent oxidoreductase, partial [Pseudomonadota bacterium]